MTLNPLEAEFWEEAARNGWGLVAPVMLDILLAGGKSGEILLPAAAKPLISWDLFNRDAIAWLRAYRGGVFGLINETTRKNVVGAITDWIQAGDPLPVLEAQIGRWFAQERASNIAITEVTRAYAEGNTMAWRSAGVVGGKRWNTAFDERVCLICRPLNGMIVGLDNGFWSREGGVGMRNPPAHPRCRCWLTPIVDDEAVGRQRQAILDEYR